MLVSNIIGRKTIDGNVYFDNFIVIKEKEDYFCVYRKEYGCIEPIGKMVAYASTMYDAANKAKLLQMGFNLAKKDMDDWW